MFPRTAYLLEPGTRGSGAVVMVIDELLVGERAARDPVVTARLAVLGASDTGATVFGGVASPPAEDVADLAAEAPRAVAGRIPTSPRSYGTSAGRSWRGTSR